MGRIFIHFNDEYQTECLQFFFITMSEFFFVQKNCKLHAVYIYDCEACNDQINYTLRFISFILNLWIIYLKRISIPKLPYLVENKTI